jgi:hypothetical protein
MSLASIATNLYTIQSRKNVPLKTAFSMLVREDMAMRFSVYNLVKIVTKSEFLATVAQTAYGKRTPLQKAQDEEDRKREMNDKKFKVYTQVTFARINNRLNLLTSIAERNNKLIMNLYSEIGYFRGQRRMSLNSGIIPATRVMMPSKTIKNKIEEIQKELDQLKGVKQPRTRPRGAMAKKKAGPPTKQEENGFMNFLPILLSNPRLLGLLFGGAAGAVSLGSFAAQAYSMFNTPGAISRVAGRLGGKQAYGNQLTEDTSQTVDAGILGLGTYTAGRIITSAASKLKKPKAESGIATINRLTKMYRGKGMDYRTSQKKAGEAAKTYGKRVQQLKKWRIITPAFSFLSKRFPALAAADVAFEISRMSGYVADHSAGKMNNKDFETNMTNGYAELISTVGIGGMSTAIGGLAGTALFPGLGTAAGLIGGGVIGGLASLFIDEDNATMQSIANKVFKMLHDDQAPARGSKLSMREQIIQGSGATSADGKPKKTSFIDSIKEFMGYTKPVGETMDASRAMDYFIAQGWTPQQAAGIVGNLQAESGPNLSTNAVGDGGKAYGIAQWHPDRQATFAEVYKKDIRQSTINEQLAYVQWELMNSEKAAGAILRGAGDPSAAAQIVDEHYERSAGIHRAQRIANAMALMKGYESRRGMPLVNMAKESAQQMTPSVAPLSYIPNAPVSTMPSAEDGPRAEPDLQARIDSTVAINYGKIVKNQMTAGIGAVNQKITDLSKKTTTEFPFSTNPEASISSYKT